MRETDERNSSQASRVATFSLIHVIYLVVFVYVYLSGLALSSRPFVHSFVGAVVWFLDADLELHHS